MIIKQHAANNTKVLHSRFLTSAAPTEGCQLQTVHETMTLWLSTGWSETRKQGAGGITLHCATNKLTLDSEVKWLHFYSLHYNQT